MAMSTDEEAIRNLLGRHAQLTDDGDVAGRVKLYVEDGAYQMGEQRSVGRQQIEASFSATAPNMAGGKHVTSNMVIELQSGTADVRTDFAYFRTSVDGVTAVAVGRYYDKVEKHDGEWLIRERRIVPVTPG
jgi:3-phenylpropionate/cinnamic acid dioxygenase small subunit